MLNLEIKTSLSVPEVSTRLKSFFSEGGLGMKISDETETCLTFEGGGGYVNTTFRAEENKTRINLKTQEWEIQVKKFASSVS